jgi:hypothetical protein
VDPGRLLDGRYRLDEHRFTIGDRQLWLATDEVLERRVAVHIVSGRTRTDAKTFAAAAGRAGSVPDARWVRILDVGLEPAGRKVDVWIVSEWIDGQSLTAMLRKEPLKESAAVTLVTECAQAVAAAHHHGAGHGALHPDEVLIQPDGSARLTGLEIHLALSPDPPYDDVRGLGALLFAAVTGHWPLTGWHGLPPVTRGDGRHPRQQRFGVGKVVDDIAARALNSEFSDPAAMARALTALPSTPLGGGSEDVGSPTRERLRRVAWWVVPPILVAVVGLLSWGVGSRLGKVPGETRGVSQSLTQSHGHGAADTLVWTKPPTIKSFDPEGNGIEDPGGVGLVVDDDPSTSWTTDTYRGSAHFGGLKDGVGLLIDLGHAKRVAAARLLLSAPGADIELRAGSSPPVTSSDLPIVASGEAATTSLNLHLNAPVRARYWLVWITSLPRTERGEFSLGIAEIALLH